MATHTHSTNSEFSEARILVSCLSHSWGGQEMVAFEQAQELTARGITCWLLTLKNSVSSKKAQAAGISTFEVPEHNKFSLQVSMQIHNFIIENEISTITSHQLPDLWVLSPALWKLPAVQLIGFSHTFVRVNKKDVLHRMLYNRVNELICLTERQKQNLLQHLPVKESVIKVIPNGVNTERFNPRLRSEKVRRDLGADENETLIAVVGRLDVQKGQLEMVEAAAEMKNKNIPFKMFFIGKDTPGVGAASTEIKALIAERGVSDFVKLIDHREDIAQVMASLDIFVLPSYEETFGRVVVEAMASQVAIVATDAGGVPDIIRDRRDGLLVTPKDAHSLASAMEELIAKPDLQKMYANNARARAKQIFSVDLVDKQIFAILNQNVSSRVSNRELRATRLSRP
jgi:glycosyltransferase involved in cell wall biosynthesis